jgi:hypothetical protein
MPWTPEETLLGTHAELENFAHSIQYYEPGESGDPEAVPPVEAGEDIYYTVRIIPQEVNPNTVTFSVGDPGVISGFYKGIFNDSLTTRNESGNITTITTLGAPEGSVFTKVNRVGLSEVISFKADTTRSRTFTYVAEAFDNNPISPTYLDIIATNVYTILAQDRNWTPGQLNLKELVSNASGNSTE